MALDQCDVLVIGAGVSGLTTAVLLAEAGFRVQIRTGRPPPQSTSFAAGAIWGPYLVGHPHASTWSDRTLAYLTELARHYETGVRMVTGIEAARKEADPPQWAIDIPGFQRCAAEWLPDGFVSGWRYTVPVVDMPKYLNYLVTRLTRAGVDITTDPLSSLADAVALASIVVNCAGVGARELVPDVGVYPVRGQLVVVENPGIDYFFAEHTEDVSDLTYFLPQGDHVVLGGSADADRLDPEPDLAMAEAIVRRCRAIEPMLDGVRVLQHRVGFRPGRARVRVELELVAGRPVIHNYGHGGAGLTLSWGCASEVRDLIRGLAVIPLPNGRA